MKANLTAFIPLERAEYAAHTDPKDPTKSLIKVPNGNPEKRTLDYFKFVNASRIKELYQCYRLDFELFKYNLRGLL